MLWNRINCDSYCGPCDFLGRVLVIISPFAALLCGFFALMFFFTYSKGTYYYPSEDHSMVPLSITVGLLLIPLILLIYEVCYLRSFFSLVRRNFARVPRNRVLSNMVYVQHLRNVNDHLEISGHIAAALKRGEVSYNQINDRTALSSLTVQVGVALDPVEIMVYSYAFIGYLDNHRDGFVKKVNYLVLTIIIFIMFIIMLVIASRR